MALAASLDCKLDTFSLGPIAHAVGASLATLLILALLNPFWSSKRQKYHAELLSLSCEPVSQAMRCAVCSHLRHLEAGSLGKAPPWCL